MTDECSILWGKRGKRNSVVEILSSIATKKSCALPRQKFNVAYSAPMV
jgi:hypothetical protein